MGNLQNKEGNGGSFASSLNVPPGNLLEAVARASSEAARIRGEQEKRAATEFDSDEEDYDSDLEDEVRSESKNAGSNDKRGYSEPPDPKYPWLISSRASMECEQEKINVMKQKCKDNYPGMSSSYIDKIKVSKGIFFKEDFNPSLTIFSLNCSTVGRRELSITSRKILHR